MCYLAEGGRSALKDIDIDSGEPTRLGSAVAPPHGTGAWLTPVKQASSPCVTTSNLVVLRQKV